MARKPAIEVAREWFAAAGDGDPQAMAQLLSEDALFHAEAMRGRRFQGRDEIEAFLAETGFEATGYTYTAVDDEYVVVSASLRRHLPSGGLADSTLAMVFKVEGDEIVCMDAFPTTSEALRSLQKN